MPGMPDRTPQRTSECMSDQMPGLVPDKMSEAVSNRLPEHMSEGLFSQTGALENQAWFLQWPFCNPTVKHTFFEPIWGSQPPKASIVQQSRSQWELGWCFFFYTRRSLAVKGKWPRVKNRALKPLLLQGLSKESIRVSFFVEWTEVSLLFFARDVRPRAKGLALFQTAGWREFWWIDSPKNSVSTSRQSTRH